MKLDTYEVPFGTDGRTLRVNTVNIFDVDTMIIDNGNNNIKKIKTKKEQVENAKMEYSRAVALNMPSVEPVIEEPVVVEEPKIVMPEVGHRYSFETAME